MCIQCKFKASHYLSCQTAGTLSNSLRQYELTNGLQFIVFYIGFAWVGIFVSDLFSTLKVGNSPFRLEWKWHVNKMWKSTRKLKLFAMVKLNAFSLPASVSFPFALTLHVCAFLFMLFCSSHRGISFFFCSMCQPNECHLLLCTFTVLHFAHLI